MNCTMMHGSTDVKSEIVRLYLKYNQMGIGILIICEEKLPNKLRAISHLWLLLASPGTF